MASGNKYCVTLPYDVLHMILDMTPVENWYSDGDRRKNLCSLRLVSRLFNAEVRRRFRIAITDPNNGHSLSKELHQAAIWDKADYVRFLIDNGADVNLKVYPTPEPLLTAALRGSVNVVVALLERGASVEVGDIHRRSPIEVAGTSRRSAVVGALLKSSSQKNIGSVLRGAARNNDDKTLKVILDSKVTISQDDLDQALVSASYKGNKTFAEALLDRGASATRVFSTSASGIDPYFVHCLQATVEGNQVEVAKLLLDRGAGIHIDYPGSLLRHATAGRHLRMVKFLLENGADVNHDVDRRSRSPLHAAASEGDVEIVRLLLQHGADVYALGTDLSSTIEAARLTSGGEEVIRLLLDAESRSKLGG